MKIVAFAGSNSKNSINKQLVEFIVSKFTAEQIDVLDLNDFEAPIYSVDRESEFGFPEVILGLAQKISDADLIVLSLAEHNGSYSAAFKNVYDWVSRIPNRKVFDGTKLFLLSTSPGGRGGQSVMETASARFPRDGAELIASFSLPNFYENFTPGVGIHVPNLLLELETKIETIQKLF